MGVTHVKCNIEDHRVLDSGVRCEDVTSFTPPTLEHPTTEVKNSGMVMDVDIPNIYHFNAMEVKIAHNNGKNCSMLARPGVHNLEFRGARQDYVVAQGEIELELVKFRITCVHRSTEKGEVETDNPYGSTETYSVLRYSEEIAGEETVLIDSMAGIIRIDGVDYGDRLGSLLD